MILCPRNFKNRDFGCELIYMNINLSLQKINQSFDHFSHHAEKKEAIETFKQSFRNPSIQKIFEVTKKWISQSEIFFQDLQNIDSLLRSVRRIKLKEGNKENSSILIRINYTWWNFIFILIFNFLRTIFNKNWKKEKIANARKSLLFLEKAIEMKKCDLLTGLYPKGKAILQDGKEDIVENIFTYSKSMAFQNMIHQMKEHYQTQFMTHETLRILTEDFMSLRSSYQKEKNCAISGDEDLSLMIMMLMKLNIPYNLSYLLDSIKTLPEKEFKGDVGRVGGFLECAIVYVSQKAAQ